MGDDAVKAIIKEVKQLDNKRAFQPLKASALTNKERQGALEFIARTCADGRKQHNYVDKVEASSPTISLEALMMIILTAPHKDCEVLVAEIVGAYLNADMEDFVVMKFRDRMVDCMVQANPKEYKTYVKYKNGKKVLYVKLLKAL